MNCFLILCELLPMGFSDIYRFSIYRKTSREWPIFLSICSFLELRNIQMKTVTLLSYKNTGATRMLTQLERAPTTTSMWFTTIWRKPWTGSLNFLWLPFLPSPRLIEKETRSNLSTPKTCRLASLFLCHKGAEKFC